MTPIRQDEAGDWIYIDPETNAEYEINPDDQGEVEAVRTLLEAETAAEQVNEESGEQEVDLRDEFLAEKEKALGRKLTAAEVQRLDSHVEQHGQVPEDDEWTHNLDSEEGRQRYMTEAATSPSVGGYARAQ